jgi:hypothetical protein
MAATVLPVETNWRRASPLEPRLASLSAAYVLLMAILGPITARIVR